MTTTQRSAHPTVGFVGLGDQGAPIAAAIADAGYPLQVWARRPVSLKALTGVPFTAHATVAALAAASNIVALCLPEDSDNLEVATTGGLLAHMRRGSVLVNHGTGTPRAMQQLAELAAPYGIEVVDASSVGAAPSPSRVNSQRSSAGRKPWSTGCGQSSRRSPRK